MKNSTSRLCAVVGLAAIAFGCSSAGTAEGNADDVGQESSALIADQVKHYWSHYKRDDVKKEWSTIDQGKRWGGDYLGWHESFVLESLVDMYHATRDTKFTDELVAQADAIFDLRDDKRGQKDDARGKTLKAWGSYLNLAGGPRGNDWICEIVENGMLTYPIAEFVHAADESPALAQRYGTKIDRYRAMLFETVEAFDDDWEEHGDEGFYKEPKKYPVYPPAAGKYAVYNKALALGKTLATLALTKLPNHQREKLKDHVRKMNHFFSHRARTSGSGRIVWDYASWIPDVDDVGHGGIVAEFFALAGHVDASDVGRGDLDAFIHTFEYLTDDANKVDGYVDGAKVGSPGPHAHAIDQKDANQACGRYLSLAAYEPALADRCKKLIDAGFDEHQSGFAKWLRYRKS